MKITVTVGISGSGKSTYLLNNYPTSICVCPDDIREELTGSVSDQSKNPQVWKIAFERIKNAIDNNKDVVLSATNLKFGIIKDIEKISNSSIELEILFFNDSFDWKLCRDRVKHDIENKVNRSRTHDVMVDNMPLIEIMYHRYKSIYNLVHCSLRDYAWRFNSVTVFDIENSAVTNKKTIYSKGEK